MELFKETPEALEKLGALITTQEIKQQPTLWQEAFDNYKDQRQKIEQFILCDYRSRKRQKNQGGFYRSRHICLCR